MSCSSHRDTQGHHYTIPKAEAVIEARSGLRLRGYPSVDVWWSRDGNSSKAAKNSQAAVRSQETLIIRQEYEERPTADVIELTFGQAYDLIDALNKAIEHS